MCCIILNKKSSKPIFDYAVTIDTIEKETEIDFFHNLPDDLEDKIEGSIEKSKWTVMNTRTLIKK